MRGENPRNLPPGYTLDRVGYAYVTALHRDGEWVIARITQEVEPEHIKRAAAEDRTGNEHSDLRL
jgi:hypothetical protein